MTDFWDGQVEQNYADEQNGVYENADPLTAGEPDAFPRFLGEPALPIPDGSIGPLPTDGAPAAPDLVPGGDPVAIELSYLRQIRDGTAGAAAAMAITAESAPPILDLSWPVRGVSRWLIGRAPDGGEIAIPEGPEYTAVCNANASRIGGSLVNGGTHPAVFALRGVDRAGLPRVGLGWLQKEGGSWDFRESGILWCGPVSARGLGGATTLFLTEV